MTTEDEMRAARRRKVDREGRRRRRLAHLAGQPTNLVPAGPIRVKLREMANLGWSYEALVCLYGVGSRTGLNLIADGASLRCEQKFAPIADIPATLHVPDSVGDNMWVPTLGATRRIRALLALGWRHDDITAMIGRSSHSIASGTYLRTRAIDWRIVDATYERMSSAPGASTRTAQRAAAAGYAPPFAWDDIDNPSEQPAPARRTRLVESSIDDAVVDRLLNEGTRPRRLTNAEGAEVTRRLRATGMSDRQIRERYGMKPERYSREDVA